MIKHFFAFLTIQLSFSSACSDSFAIDTFRTDGCSLFPNGTIVDQSLWLHCCVEHDRAYWQGGTYNQRLEADKQLHKCVSEAGAPFIAELMLEGVRFGGSPFFPTTYRWGYGWQWLRGYKPLSPSEKAEVTSTYLESINGNPHSKD